MTRNVTDEPAPAPTPTTPPTPTTLPTSPPDHRAETAPASSAPAMARAVSVQLGGRVVGMIASVLTVALTTRHLGVEGYGLLTTAVVFVGLWTSLTELGVGAVIVRRVASGDGDLGRLVGINTGLSLAYCVPLGMLAAVTGLLVYLERPAVHGVLVIVCGSLVLTTVATCFQPVFVSTVRFGAVAVGDVLCRLATLGGTAVVIALDGGLVWFGVVQLVAPAVQIVVQGLAARRLTRIRPHFDRGLSLALLRESLPQTGVLIIGVLYWRIDAVLLSLLGGTRDVGAYGIAYTAAFTLSVLSSFYLASSLSEMAARFASGGGRFAQFVESGMQAMIFLGLPIAVVGGVLARPLITLLGSRGFADRAAVPFTLLVVCVALTFFTGVLSQALFAAHEQVFLLRLNVVNLALNVVLNVVLAPTFGATGSAAALLASEVSGLLVVTWRLRRLGYRTPLRFTARLVPALAVAAVVAVLLRGTPVILAGAAAGAAYLVINLVAGPVRSTTVRALFGRGGAGTPA